MIKGIITAISGLISIFGWFQRKSEREEHKQTGRMEAENAQLKEQAATERRMRIAGRLRKSVDDSLRDRSF